MNLSDTISEYAAGSPITFRKQCGIPLTDEIICPEEAIGEIKIPLEDGMELDMPICEGHLEAVAQIKSLQI